MPDRHSKNRAGGIPAGRRREQEVLQVGNPALPVVPPRVQENPKVLQEGDQRFRGRNRYLVEENREGYCQVVAEEEVREEVLNQVEAA
jgi:hypothetical protein